MISKAKIFKYFPFLYYYFEDNLAVQVAPPGIRVYTVLIHLLIMPTLFYNLCVELVFKKILYWNVPCWGHQL